MIRQDLMRVNFHLEDLSNLEKIHQYPSLCRGYEIWNTRWSDSKDDGGDFNRYVEWGPFQNLVAELEDAGLMDNKIVLVYQDGLHIGFYDGSVRIGTSMSSYVSPYSISSEEIQKRLKK